MRDTAFALFAMALLILGCNQITGLNDLNLSLDTGSETSSVVDNSTDTASTSTQSSDDTDNDTVSDTDTSTTTDTDASSDSSKDTIDDTVSDSASDTQTDTATYTGSDTGDDTSSDSTMDTQPDTGDDTSLDSAPDTRSDTETNVDSDTGTEEIPAVCGDGIKHPTEEVCDMGESNGEFDQCDVSCLFICNRNCPLRVDLVNGDDGNDGKSWGAAKLTIQAAIDAQSSASGGDVWVTTGESSGSIAMAPGVPLYGGFAGTEQVISERDADSRTTLRGDGSLSVSLPMVAGARNSEINGFHIVEGNATYHTSVNPKINGGGLAAVNISSLTVANCIFENNTAIQFGGAMTIENSTVDIIDSSFLSNYASSGGAISITDSSTVTISGARFDTNYLVDSGPFPIIGGGALYVTDSTLSVTDCDFVANAPYDITETTEISFGYGTAINSMNGTVTVRDSEFYGNRLMIPERTVVTHNNTATQYINCTFAGHGGPTDNAVVQFEGAAESAVVGCTFSNNDMIQVNASTATNASISNTLFYMMTLLPGEDALISGAPTEQNNCSNYISGRPSTSLVLEASPSDGDGDGVPEYFLRQNDDNPCFIMGGDDSAANAAGIDWENMTTAQSGCTDVSPVDVGRHYSVAPGSHECL